MQHHYESNHKEDLEFAATDRISFEAIQQAHKDLLATPAVAQILEAVPLALVIFDNHRQVIHANSKALELSGSTRASEVIGLRMGEFLGDDHHMEGLNCKKDECQNCNAMDAIVGALRGDSIFQEKKLVMHPRDPEDKTLYQISGSPLTLHDGSQGAIICLQPVE